MRELGITIYPTKNFDLVKCKEELNKAKKYGFTRTFLTFFCVPPQDIADDEYLRKIKDLSKYAKSLGIKVQADFFPEIFDAFGATPSNIKPIIDSGIDEIRIDGGFSFAEMADMSNQECGKIIINASELEETEEIKGFDTIVENGIREFLAHGGNIEKIEASHNMYPHEGTGLLMSLLTERAGLFKQYGIPVSAFCNSKTFQTTLFNAMDGSPTVEEHREISAYASCHELLVSSCIDSVFTADGFISEKELSLMTTTIKEEHPTLRIHFYPTATKEEKSLILDTVHMNRQAGYCIRSTLTREKVELVPNNTVVRHKYDVTIDNQEYERYLGEVQIQLKECLPNTRVNVIGYIDEEDQRLLQWLKNGQKFQFKEIE